MTHITRRSFAAGAAALPFLGRIAPARAAEPIRIGFSMELTGPFAVVGKTGLLAFKIWEEQINKKGGLLGRPVKLVYYDDQSNPSLVPGIYTKLIEIDKVDLLVSSYGTNLVVPAMPVVIQNSRLFFGLFALAANDQFHYPKYFSMLVFGPEPVKTFAEGYFELAMAQEPKPQRHSSLSANQPTYENRALRPSSATVVTTWVGNFATDFLLIQLWRLWSTIGDCRRSRSRCCGPAGWSRYAPRAFV